MNRRAGVFAGAALLGILLVVATATWGELIKPVPAPDGVATGAPSPSAVAPSPPPPASTAAMPYDFNGDGFADLVVGVQSQEFGDVGDAGGVHVLYGSIDGFSAAENEIWSRDSADILGDAETNDQFGAALASGDFDRDGYADLAVGAPDFGEGRDAGSVNVLRGSAAGLTSADNQLWSVGDLPGLTQSSGYAGGLGGALSSGDFDDDGFFDLAIGWPSVEDEGQSAAGAVAVLRGSAVGLAFRGELLTRRLTGATYLLGDYDYYGFGNVLAAGDLNGDGIDDLAVAVTGPSTNGGEVAAFYGSDSGLIAAANQLWTQDSPGIRGKAFGNDDFATALAIGDFDLDGFDDLAIGAPGEGFDCTPSCTSAGAVNVIHGSLGGLSAEGNQYWDETTPGVPGNYEEWDQFGRALAAGDFNGDGFADLAIGAPGEDQSRRSKPFGAGAVTVLLGSWDGLTTTTVRRWTQDSAGVPSDANPGEMFGASLSSAQFGGSPRDDLVIGVPRERVPGIGHVGMLNLLFGSDRGLTGQGAQGWSTELLGIGGPPRDEHFGTVLGP